MTPIRSEAYLEFVRSQPCVFCARRERVHAHHHRRRRGGGGMGLKTDDLSAVPLCAEHHGELHQRGRVGPRDALETDARLDRAVTELLRMALLEGLRVA